MPKNPHADFAPSLEGYSGQGKFRFWCQMALPLTYDDSLSYYELLCKVVNYLNNTIEDVSDVETNVSRLSEAYTQLQDYVNDYFDDLDIEAELRNVLDAMAEDGTLDDLLDPLVQDHLPAVVDEQIDDVVADQIDDAVAGQIDDVVAEQLPPLVNEGIPGEVNNWLTENVDPVGSAVVVDSSLTISGAAADAKVTGDELADLKTQINALDTNMNGVIASMPEEAITKEDVPVNIEWFQGGIDNTGAESSINVRIKSDYIPIGNGIEGRVIANNRSYWVRCYNASEEYVTTATTNANGVLTEQPSAAATTNPIIVDTITNTLPNIKYLRLVVKDSNNSAAAVLPSESGMSFTTEQEIISGVELDTIYKRITPDGQYSANDISLQYSIGNGYYTKGYLKLPPNYESAQSVPLIVFVHGSGDFGLLDSPAMTVTYNDYYNYLRDCGYAIFDCYAFGNKYTYSQTTPNTYGIPLNNECYKKGIEYVKAHYKINDKIFVACKSLGGIQASSMFYDENFDIAAIGMLAPELDILDVNMGYSADVKKLIADELDFTPDTGNVLDFGGSDPVPTGFWDYITANIPHWCGVFTAFNGVSISNAQKPSYYKRLFDMGAMSRVTRNIPLKIWIASDDTTVSFANAQALVSSINNYGYNAILREMPTGTGGHHSVDNDANALQKTNVTTPLGVYYASIPLAYYELEQFFRAQY